MKSIYVVLLFVCTECIKGKLMILLLSYNLTDLNLQVHVYNSFSPYIIMAITAVNNMSTKFITIIRSVCISCTLWYNYV